MKIRIGFVSNSSSCSFLVVGIDVTNLDINREEVLYKVADKDKLDKEVKEMTAKYKISKKAALEDLFYDYMNNSGYILMDHPENGAPDKDTKIIGFELASFDGESGKGNMTTDEIKQAAVGLREKFDLSEDAPVKVYWGTRMC